MRHIILYVSIYGYTVYPFSHTVLCIPCVWRYVPQSSSKLANLANWCTHMCTTHAFFAFQFHLLIALIHLSRSSGSKPDSLKTLTTSNLQVQKVFSKSESLRPSFFYSSSIETSLFYGLCFQFMTIMITAILFVPIWILLTPLAFINRLTLCSVPNVYRKRTIKRPQNGMALIKFWSQDGQQILRTIGPVDDHY